MEYTQSPKAFLSARITATLVVTNQVNENLGITVKLKIMSEVTNFITQILAFLGYCGNSFAKTE